jgi:uncharacterized protein (TIGR02186 family)
MQPRLFLLHHLLPVPVILLVVLLGCGPAMAQQLIADLSHRIVNITTGFNGADVLVFGATKGSGDVILVVRGPEETTVVRRKERVAGIWVNSERVAFERVPSFLYVAASRVLSAGDIGTLMRRFRINVDLLEPKPTEPHPPEEVATFRAALMRNKERNGLYDMDVGRVIFIGDNLFRANLQLPANVPTGPYLVEVFDVQDGKIMASAASVLVVAKAGFGAEVFRFAHEYAAIYGLIAILIALMAGWTAGMVFRKA